MNTKHLAALAALLGLLNPVAAITTAIEHMPDSEPVMLALMAVPWLVGAELLRRNKVLGGGVIVSLLCVLDLVSAPGWRRDSVADWTEQSFGAAAALVCLAVAVTLIVRRNRVAIVAGAAS